MLNVPVRVPGEVGVYVTVNVQLAPGNKTAPQVLVWAKSPLMSMPLRLKAEFPVLVRAIV